MSEHDAAWKNSLKLKGRWCAQIQDEFPKSLWFKKFPYVDRRHITTIIRMRSGHCLTNKYLHQIGVKNNPNCECGQIEDLNHIFCECPINKIPNFDLYTYMRNKDIPNPISITNILNNMSNEIIKIIIKFLSYNKIKL